MDHYRQGHAPEPLICCPCSGPSEAKILHVDQQVSLGPMGGTRRYSLRHRRLVVLMWGVFLRTVVGLHATLVGHSATHMWGSRRFLTEDTSTNSFWVGDPGSLGEGWPQQSPRGAQAGQARPYLVRNRCELVGNLGAGRNSGLAWDILSCRSCHQ